MQCVRVSFLDSQFRQHSEGGGGDEDYFFSGFGDLQEYGESDGQHGSGRDYDYFEVTLVARIGEKSSYSLHIKLSSSYLFGIWERLCNVLCGSDILLPWHAMFDLTSLKNAAMNTVSRPSFSVIAPAARDRKRRENQKSGFAQPHSSKSLVPQDHDYQGGGDVGHTGGHAGGRGGSGSGGGGGHHDDGGDPSFNGDDFTHFEREFRGGITPTDYYEDCESQLCALRLVHTI